MGIISSLLGANSQVVKVAQNVNDYITYGMQAILGVCAILMVIYAVYVGFKLGTAEDQTKRKNARDQLVYAIVGLLVAAATFGLLTVSYGNGNGTIFGFTVFNYTAPTGGNLSAKFTGPITTILATTKEIVLIVLKLAYAGAGLFAFYAGWQLMKAEEAGKRTEAKKQIMWVALGMVGAVLIYVVAQVALPGIT